MTITNTEPLAPGCTCGNCTPACSTRLFFPCCGACMNTKERRPRGTEEGLK